MSLETTLFWTAASLYGVASFAAFFGLISRSERLFSVGLWSTGLGFLAHTATIGLRWVVGGVSPFITTSESLTFGTWMATLIFLVTQLGPWRVRPLGVLVSPVVFTLLGWAGTMRADAASQLAPALQSGWIWIHIVGATSGFGAVLIAAGLGLLHLLKERNVPWLPERLPALPELDALSYRYVVGGFIMYGVMIVSGAFWANQVKGMFWNWDPVEVWSLVSWLTYGIYLHLRITMGWRGRKLAIYSLFALAAMIVSYWGIPFTIDTFHSGFRVEH